VHERVRSINFPDNAGTGAPGMDIHANFTNVASDDSHFVIYWSADASVKMEMGDRAKFEQA